jgi:extracellular elastinolytic metalloproteinase
MRVTRWLFAAHVVGVGLFACGSTALAADVPIDGAHALRDLDTRAGTIRPTAAQRADARAVGAQVAWNRFGTPSTLVDPGGTLATGVRGATPEAAARAWVEANKALFRLDSIDEFELLSDSALAGDVGHAVTLRQTAGGLEAAGGGLLTIGLAKEGAGWRVISAAGTVNGDTTLAAKPQLALEEAVQRAAANAGARRSLAQIVPVDKSGLKDFKGYKLAGVPDVQRAKAVAFPTVDRGFVPAYETLVLDTQGAEPSAYRTFVDARSGAILARESLVDHESDEAQAAAAPQTFSGELPAQDGGCDTRKGPYAVAPDAGVRAIDVFANADTPAQDIVLKLFRGDVQVAQADTLRTPERIRFAPATGVPAGDYFVQVCEFGDRVPPVEPRTYSGTVTLDTSTPPAPYTARWRAFPGTPPHNALTSDPWNNPSTDTREDWCWKASSNAADCDDVVGNLASRAPWDHDVKANTPSFTTIGNNARTAESWTDPSVPAPFQFRPVSAGRDYTFPWTNAWNTSDCNPGDPYGAAFVPGQSFDISAAVTNLFVQHNRMHDWAYLLGFTEENWNAQDSNFGATEPFRENDPVVGDAQAGAAVPPPLVYAAARNNANMITLPEGSSSITNMYLWQPVAGAFYAPCVDGDYDAGVIGHEYTHMIENRMIGKGANRSGHHAGAMGESVADLLSIEQLNEHGNVPADGANRWATGTYATGQKLRGIRNYAGNFPATGSFPTPGVYAQVNPLNLSDIGYDLTGPQVHADGEIWTATNFDLRKALAAKYDAQYPEGDQALQEQCAKGQVPVERCPGNRRWIQLVLDSFLLMPTAPSMVDARNAILAADTIRFGGANQSELWLGFARRGLGRNAASTNGTGRAAGAESDTNPLPDFEAPGQGNGTLTFATTARDAGQAPPKARVYVGHYEARVSPIADTDPATSAPAGSPTDNLDATATFAPGTYEFVATAPGYGAVRFRHTVRAGVGQTVTLRMAANVASKSQGATASGNADPVMNGTREVLSAAQVRERLIDDTEATQWQAAAVESGASWNVDGRQITVDLAGTRPERVNRVQVSALLGPVFDAGSNTDLSPNRFTALRQFEIWSCNALFGDCSSDEGYNRVYASAANAFPADAPRPVAPALLLREFTFSPVQATHLRLVVRHSQCTGGPDFQGEQDADPHNATDCNDAGSAATRFVRAAELQAFGQPSQVQVGR